MYATPPTVSLTCAVGPVSLIWIQTMARLGSV
jgi:hypothetical protein